MEQATIEKNPVFSTFLGFFWFFFEFPDDLGTWF
jgi:hypothetical protein